MSKKWPKLSWGKRRIFIGAAFLAAAFLIGLIFWPRGSARLEVDYLDVGQGDSSLIKTPTGQVILIDGGPDKVVLRRLGENLPFNHRRIDLIIISHRHEDHISGLVEVLKRYDVGRIIYAAGGDDNATWETLLAEAKREKVTLSPLTDGLKVAFRPDCYLNLLPPASLGVKADPNNSLAAKLDCLGKKFLWFGDSSSVVENALLKTDWDPVADVFKASHHASNSANGQKFLQAVNPKLVVISVGADNKFGHPAPKVLERLQALAMKFKRTDQAGTVKIMIP